MSNQAIIYRRVKDSDYPELLNIASEYYRDSPSFDEANGFLNNHFNKEMLAAIG